VSIGRQSSIASGLYIVSGDITHIQRRVDNSENPRAFLFSGTANEIMYLLEERPESSEGGIYWIRLHTRNTPNGQELVRARRFFDRQNTRPPSGEWPDETTLMRVDAEITFAYRATRSGNRNWQTDWSSPNQMPDQIRIDITDKKTGRHRVPPFVQSLKQSAEADCAVPTAPACTLQSAGALIGKSQ
jgi:hypothetical protein